MKYFPLGFVFAVFFFAIPLAAQEVAYARYSPLPVYTPHSEGDEIRKKVSIGFGEALPIIELSNDAVLVSLPTGDTARLELADVVLSNVGEYVLPGINFDLEDRAKLSFWDSKLRAQGFLQYGPSEETIPFLKEAGVATNIPALPVVKFSSLYNSLGNKVQVAQSLVPVSNKFLHKMVRNEQQAVSEIDLHIVVDGSNYARDFAQRRLHAFSRRVTANDDLKKITLTRSVILENGKTVGPDSIQLSGLRQFLPQNSNSDDHSVTIAQGLTTALRNLTVELEDYENFDRKRIILILVGPSVQENILDDPEFASVVSALQQQMRDGRAGIMIGAVTPEPSEMPRLLLSQLGIGVPGAVVDFTDRLDHAISLLSDKISASDTTSKREEQICYYFHDKQTFCLTSENMGAVGRVLQVSASAEFEWSAVPLWHIIDGTTLVLDRKNNVRESVALRDAQNSHKDIMINVLNEEVKSLREKIDGVTELHVFKSQEMAAEVLTWSSRHAALEEELDVVSQQKEELRATLTSARDNANVLKSRLKTLEEKYADERDNGVLLQQMLKKVRADLRTIDTEKQLVQETLSELALEKSHQDQQVALILEKNTQAISELSKLTEDNKALLSKTASLSQELQNSENEKNTLKVMNDEKDSRIRGLASDVLSLEALLGDKEARIASLNAERSAFRAEYNSVVEKADIAGARIKDLQSQVSELERFINKLQSEKSKSLEKEQSLVEQLSLAKSQVTEFKKAKSENNAAILELHQKNMKLQALNESLSTKKLASNQELRAQKNSYTKLEVQFNDMKKRLNDLNGKNSQLQADIQERNLRVSNLQAERDEVFSLLRNRTENFLKEQNQIQKNYEGIAVDTSSDDLPSVIKNYRDAIIDAQKQIQTLNNVQNALKDELKVTKSRLAHQTADFAVEKAQFSSEMTRFREEATQLRERLVAREVEFVELQKERTSLSGHLEQHVAQISQLNNLLMPIGEKLAIDLSQEKLPEAIERYNEVFLDTLDRNDELVNKNQVLEVAVAELRQSKLYEQHGEDEVVIRLQEVIEARDDIVSQREFEINKLQSENEEMRARIEIAMGVAEENVQLISAIKNAERVWLRREAALQNQIKLLNQKISSVETTGIISSDDDLTIAQTGQSSEQIARLDEDALELNISLRPVSRPQNLSSGASPPREVTQADREAPQPSSSRRVATTASSREAEKPNALPGSLFIQRSSAGTAQTGFQTSGGFFGN